MLRTLLAASSTLVIIAGCTPRAVNRWDPPTDAGTAQTPTGGTRGPAAAAGPIKAEVAGKRLVLFAPTAIGALAEAHPAARLDLPYRMAQRIDAVFADASGRVGEVLPDSASPEWERGRVPSTTGAHLVVLTQVTDLRRERGAPGTEDQAIALVRMRGLDVDGRLLFDKVGRGAATVRPKPKQMMDESTPESLAAWEAIDHCLGALKGLLDNQVALANTPTRGGLGQPAATYELVPVTIDSDPRNADVVIDGQFRGTTPLILQLPKRPLVIVLKRQNYQTWERQVEAVRDMRIQPALEPVPGTTPAPAIATPAPAATAPDVAPAVIRPAPSSDGLPPPGPVPGTTPPDAAPAAPADPAKPRAPADG